MLSILKFTSPIHMKLEWMIEHDLFITPTPFSHLNSQT